MSDPKSSPDTLAREQLAPTDTLRGYDRWSAQYDGGDNPMIAATDWALDARPLDVAGARVVELGCGTGRNAGRVLAGGARAYLGVDGSRGMLDLARARITDARCGWAEAELADPPRDHAPFDLALIVLVLEHVADLAPVFAAAARLLRPGGALRVVEIHPDLVDAGTVAHFHDRARGAEVRFASVAHPVASLRAAAERAGFAIGHLDEHAADGALLARVPRLAKHRGRRVLLDLAAHRTTPRA